MKLPDRCFAQPSSYPLVLPVPGHPPSVVFGGTDTVLNFLWGTSVHLCSRKSLLYSTLNCFHISQFSAGCIYVIAFRIAGSCEEHLKHLVQMKLHSPSWTLLQGFKHHGFAWVPFLEEWEFFLEPVAEGEGYCVTQSSLKSFVCSRGRTCLYYSVLFWSSSSGLFWYYKEHLVWFWK